MADRAPVPANPLPFGSDVVVFWEELDTSNRNGTAVHVHGVVGPLMVQAKGTFGAGASVAWQGSLDGETTYFALNDPEGVVIAQGSAGVEVVQGKPYLIRPAMSNGDMDTDIDVYLHIHR